jgi:signal transduction histidine kinase
MLKDFSRQDSGDINVPFDLNRVLANAIAILNHEIKKRCHRFYLECGEEVPAALGNAQQIEQVLINLIMNALQALPKADCAVRVQTALEEGDLIVITVADEGEGMSAEVLKRITDPFFTTRAENGGTGLGLSITSSLVQKNHGSISFASAPGEGTTVTVRLRAFVPQPEPTRGNR